jgi:hypothetical protein
MEVVVGKSPSIETGPVEIKPRARTDKLLVRRFDGDLMVYDRDLDRANCLNGLAADVWERCDGKSSVATITQKIAEATGRPVDERAVWLAIEQLSRSQLLEEPVKAPTSIFGKGGRRRLMQALKVAAAAVPAVLSIVVPTVAQVGSCIGDGGLCVSDGQCCSFNCNGGVCGPQL